MNIFNLKEEYLLLMREIEEAEGEITPEIAEALKANEENVEEKVKAYYAIKKTKEAEIKMCKDEIERLSALVKFKETIIDRMKECAIVALELYGQTGKSGNKQLKYDTLNLYNVYNKPVKFIDENTFNNPKYMIAHTNYTISKQLIKADIEKGIEVEGAYIDNNASYPVFR